VRHSGHSDDLITCKALYPCPSPFQTGIPDISAKVCHGDSVGLRAARHKRATQYVLLRYVSQRMMRFVTQCRPSAAAASFTEPHCRIVHRHRSSSRATRKTADAGRHAHEMMRRNKSRTCATATSGRRRRPLVRPRPSGVQTTLYASTQNTLLHCAKQPGSQCCIKTQVSIVIHQGRLATNKQQSLHVVSPWWTHQQYGHLQRKPIVLAGASLMSAATLAHRTSNSFCRANTQKCLLGKHTKAATP